MLHAMPHINESRKRYAPAPAKIIIWMKRRGSEEPKRDRGEKRCIILNGRHEAWDMNGRNECKLDRAQFSDRFDNSLGGRQRGVRIGRSSFVLLFALFRTLTCHDWLYQWTLCAMPCDITFYRRKQKKKKCSEQVYEYHPPISGSKVQIKNALAF